MKVFVSLGFAVLLAGAAFAQEAPPPYPAVIPAQKLESFTVAVPFQVNVMTNVAIRAE